MTYLLSKTFKNFSESIFNDFSGFSKAKKQWIYIGRHIAFQGPLIKADSIGDVSCSISLRLLDWLLKYYYYVLHWRIRDMWVKPKNVYYILHFENH